MIILIAYPVESDNAGSLVVTNTSVPRFCFTELDSNFFILKKKGRLVGSQAQEDEKIREFFCIRFGSGHENLYAANIPI